MVQRSKRSSLNQPVELAIDENPVKSDNYSEVWVVCLIDAVVTVFGNVTKTMYEFSGYGSKVKVSSEDVEGLLKKRLGVSSCCGNNTGGNIIFALL